MIELLRGGRSIGLVSDAGTPGISDPGAVLVKRAIGEGLRVVVVPGPTAAIAALSISGFDTDRFVFHGFLPPRQTARRKVLEGLSLVEETIVLYEAPHRLEAALADIAGMFGQRRAMVIREITKMFEQSFRAAAAELPALIASSKIAGEYVIVIEGKEVVRSDSMDEALEEISALMKKGLGRKEAVKKVAEQYGLSKKTLYDRSLGE